jgi:hypothetical protein
MAINHLSFFSWSRRTCTPAYHSPEPARHRHGKVPQSGKCATIIHHLTRIARKDSNPIISMPQIVPANPSISSDFHLLPIALGLFMW